MTPKEDKGGEACIAKAEGETIRPATAETGTAMTQATINGDNISEADAMYPLIANIRDDHFEKKLDRTIEEAGGPSMMSKTQAIEVYVEKKLRNL